MSNRRKNLVSDLEERMWKRILEDFPDEITCFEDGLDTLEACVLVQIQSERLFSGPDPMEELKNADKNTRGWGAGTILVWEAHERLVAGRLLLLTGHQSRALSCARDAFECLQWADICLKDDNEAKRWLRDSKPKARPAFGYSPKLSRDIQAKAQQALSTSGTHPYLGAIVRSLNPRAVLVPERTGEADAIRSYRLSTLFSFYAILLVTGTAIEYVVDSNPIFVEKVSGAGSVSKRIESILDAVLSQIRTVAGQRT